jgi:hypothetical protein
MLTWQYGFIATLISARRRTQRLCWPTSDSESALPRTNSCAREQSPLRLAARIWGVRGAGKSARIWEARWGGKASPGGKECAGWERVHGAGKLGYSQAGPWRERRQCQLHAGEIQVQAKPATAGRERSWPSGCLAGWLSGCLAVWLSGCLSGWLVGLAGCLSVCLSGCLAGWLAGGRRTSVHAWWWQFVRSRLEARQKS